MEKQDGAYAAGIASYRQGNLDLAVHQLHRAIAQQPARAECYLALGVVLERLGQLTAAIDQFEQAVALAPRAEHHVTIAATYRRLPGRPAIAAERAHCERATVLDPASANAWYELSNVLASMGDYQAGATAARQAISRAPRDGRPHHTLAICHMFSAENELAQQHFHTANELSVRERGHLLTAQSTASQRQWHALPADALLLSATSDTDVHTLRPNQFTNADPKVHYSVLRNVQLEPNQAVPYDDVAVYDGAYSWIGGLWRLLEGPHAEVHKQNVHAAVCVRADPDNYYHWVAECLPQLLLLAERVPNFERLVLVIAAARVPEFIGQYLALLGLDSMPVLSTRSPQRVRLNVGELHQVSWTLRWPAGPEPFSVEPASVWYPPRWVLRQLRDRLRSPSTAPRDRAPAGGAIVYVVRGETALRRAVHGEAKLTAKLHAVYGSRLSIFNADKLDVAGQRDLFDSASIVVGAHGAGLTNMLFCRRQAAVIELPVLPQVLNHYRHMASALGHYYATVDDVSTHFEGHYLISESGVAAVCRAIALADQRYRP